MNKIFEQILQESSKKRFIDKIWSDLEKDPAYVMSQVNSDKRQQMPTREEITSWIDSGAADSYIKKLNLNWQSFSTGKLGPDNDTPLYVYLIRVYLDYKNKGGSIKNRKNLEKQDINLLFLKSGLKVANGGDCSDCDMAILRSLETDKFIFVAPLNIKGASWMNSFECGGEGAKWCIGMEIRPQFWNEKISNGDLFILAFNKQAYNTDKQNREENILKYMLQISFDVESAAWRQTDDPEDVIPYPNWKHMFGHNINEFIEAMASAVLCDSTDYYSNLWLNDDGELKEELLASPKDMQSHTLYWNDFKNGLYTEEDINAILDSEYAYIDGEDNYINSKLYSNSDNDTFDMPALFNFLAKEHIHNETILFYNCKFKSILWGPSASFNTANVSFFNCYIENFYFNDSSNGKYNVYINKDCKIKTLHWPVSKDNFFRYTYRLYVESCISDVVEQEKYIDTYEESKTKLFNNILREASKARFINKLNISQEEKDEWTSFFDSQIGQQYSNKIDWNNPAEINLENFKKIKDLADNSISKKKKANYESLRKVTKSQFSNPNDFKFLFENEDWYFIKILSHNGAVFCDSIECGGAGAKWCIGAEGDTGKKAWSWYHTTPFTPFILIIRKDATIEQIRDDDLKYIVWYGYDPEEFYTVIDAYNEDPFDYLEKELYVIDQIDKNVVNTLNYNSHFQISDDTLFDLLCSEDYATDL